LITTVATDTSISYSHFIGSRKPDSRLRAAGIPEAASGSFIPRYFSPEKNPRDEV
jgi:hypothetical protein